MGGSYACTMMYFNIIEYLKMYRGCLTHTHDVWMTPHYIINIKLNHIYVKERYQKDTLKCKTFKITRDKWRMIKKSAIIAAIFHPHSSKSKQKSVFFHQCRMNTKCEFQMWNNEHTKATCHSIAIVLMNHIHTIKQLTFYIYIKSTKKLYIHIYFIIYIFY